MGNKRAGENPNNTPPFILFSLDPSSFLLFVTRGGGRKNERKGRNQAPWRRRAGGDVSPTCSG